ncbi:MAG: ABC transporter permease [Thermoanaerobaculia bacterium]|nr:ABC transporter permease [Thermoanaerobaculia bacterium]
MRLGLVFRLFRSTASIQRKRMILTVTAIAWGTISIVLLLSFGEGLKHTLTAGSTGLGESIAICWPGETQKDFAGFPAGREISLLPGDADLLKKSIPEITSASGEMQTWSAQLSYGRKNLNKRVVGVHPEWGEMRNQVPQAGGRFLNELDQELKRRVAFMGWEIAQDLFGEEDPVGKTFTINRVPFTVVGVMKDKIQMGTYGGPDKNNTVIPISTFEALMGRRFVSVMVFKPETPELMEVAKKRFYEVLGGKYRFDPTDERAIGIWDTVESQRLTANMSIGIEIFLGIIGGLTLLIGGVGVANIMYAAITHRTREIGVLMALGARRSYVMGPLVLESLALTFLGGVIGIGVGGAIVQGLAYLQQNAQSEAMKFLGEPTFSLPVAATTVLLLGSIGFIAGYFPSRRAVSIQPAEVLRYE